MNPMFSNTVAAAPTGGFARRAPWILGHRGASAIQLENTIAAFEQAMRDGADGVELDVQCCLGGEVFVFHDDTLSRLAGRPDRLEALDADAIRSVRLEGGHAIPTLAEAMEACGPKAVVNIELKVGAGMFAASRTLVDAVARDVSRQQAWDRVVVSSFNPRVVRQWAQRHRNSAFLFEPITRGVFPWPLQTRWLVRWLRPFAVHPESSLCSPAQVAAWHRQGFRVHTWTVDDPDELRRLYALGVDGIITNNPAAARSALALTP